MDDDVASTATMTSVTEDLSGVESDEVTANDFETSSLVTTSDACEEGNSTVVHTSSLQTTYSEVQPDTSMKVERDGSTNGITVSSTAGNAQAPSSVSAANSNLKNRLAGTKDHQEKGGQTSSANPLGKEFPFEALQSEPGPWYSHSCFNHYWRHYHFVSLWCQKHMEIYKNMIQQQWNVTSKQQASEWAFKDHNNQDQGGPSVFKKPSCNRTYQNRKARRRRKATKKRLRMAMKNAELAGSCSVLSMSSEEGHIQVEADEQEETSELSAEELTNEEMHMEISEEMLDFFAHTHKHRQERDAMKKNNKTAEAEEQHINIEEVRGDKKERTAAAPTERPGSKRTSQMRHLYGKGAAMIHGMETALQMTFDRNLDILQPKLWPNMPFRVIFD